MNFRKLTDSDWSTLVKWWESWPEWPTPTRDFFPDNGTGGFIVEKDNVPIVAGFIYLTNSKAVLLEWIVSDPEYREADRKQALELLINECEQVVKLGGYKYMFSIGRNKNLMSTHKKLGWNVDEKPSHELVKILN